MTDLSEKLAGLLNDPETMEKVKKMAEGLLGEDSAEEQKPMPVKTSNENIAGLLGENMPDAKTFATIMNVLSRFKETATDERSSLLSALRPHLSEPRKEKLDTALKILKIIDLLPLLRDSGLLNL